MIKHHHDSWEEKNGSISIMQGDKTQLSFTQYLNSCWGRGMVCHVHTNLDFKAMLLLVYLLDPLADGSILKKDISLQQDLV